MALCAKTGKIWSLSVFGFISGTVTDGAFVSLAKSQNFWSRIWAK